MAYKYGVSTLNIKDGYKEYDNFESAQKRAENQSKEKGVSLISTFNTFSDERLPDIYFIEGKKIEQSMPWAKFKIIAREFYRP